MTLLDGKKVRDHFLGIIANKVASLEQKPGLAVILVGSHAPSTIYVANKERACKQVGFYSKKIELPETVSLEKLLQVIDSLNHDSDIHGILCQLPLPPALESSESLILNRISAAKDVDRHPPCTAQGIMELLKFYDINPSGKHVVVVGRSNLVGKPTAELFLKADATVTICHSKTQNLSDYTRSADILIVAIGKPKFVTGDMIKEGAVVIDVGINRTDEGLVGDVNYDQAIKRSSAISPVPGGVGPMTIAMLMQNVLTAYNQS